MILFGSVNDLLRWMTYRKGRFDLQSILLGARSDVPQRLFLVLARFIESSM